MGMLTIGDIFKRLLPKRFEDEEIVEPKPPVWPPEVFAVAATIVNLSGFHLNPDINGPNSKFFGEDYLDRVIGAAKIWKKKTNTPPRVNVLWKVLLKNFDKPLEQSNSIWFQAALELMAISDEASEGIGLYDSSDSKNESLLSKVSYFLYLSSLKNLQGNKFLNSLCLEIPTSELCVQPKTITSQVGCNINSMSHHLSLLPSINIAKSRWMYAEYLSNSSEPLNLLLIPYPYEIDGKAFMPREKISDRSDKSYYFSIRQSWLEKENQALEISNLIVKLINKAKKETGHVHGVVLPELALSETLASKISLFLAKNTDLEFFVTGALKSAKKKSLPQRNLAYTAIFESHGIYRKWTQSKHHRWKLDSDQIVNYKLGHALNPNKLWWERIDISERELATMVFRTGSSLNVLVCEDLARVDPVQPVLRAIGPNLIIALLQDGSQLSDRWSARYSSILSDDPGSSVLTFTSLGMVKRSKFTETDTDFVVGHWRDVTTGSAELRLKKGSKAILLNIVSKDEENFTLDGRTDDRSTFKYILAGTHQIELGK